MRSSNPWRIGENPRHFVGALHKELVAVEFEAVGLVDLGAGLNAEHYIVGVRVFTAQVVRVVGEHERNRELTLQPEEVGLDFLFFGQPLVLDFEVEVAFAEDVLVLAGCGSGFFVLASHERLAKLTAQAAGESNQPFRMLSQVILADAGVTVEAMQAGLTGEPDQVPITFFVFGQHQQVIVFVVGSIGAMVLGLAHVEFAAEDGLDAFLLGSVEEMDRAVDVAMVGHRHGLLAEFRHAIDELVDVAGAVEERVFSVQMEVGEL